MVPRSTRATFTLHPCGYSTVRNLSQDIYWIKIYFWGCALRFPGAPRPYEAKFFFNILYTHVCGFFFRIKGLDKDKWLGWVVCVINYILYYFDKGKSTMFCIIFRQYSASRLNTIAPQLYFKLHSLKCTLLLEPDGIFFCYKSEALVAFKN